ncbi:MAG: PepSY domain-containing protein [Sphingomicrobium sp.]
MGAVRSRLRRWHVWLGWIVGIPILLWVVSGLIMIARPIEVVRGTDLMREPAPMRLAVAPVPPRIAGLAIKQLQLEPRAAGPRWVVTMADGSTRQADPASGALLPALSAAEAEREVAHSYRGQAKVAAVTRTDARDPPLELRRDIATWRVAMDDDTHFYVDAANGAIVARRTGWWRFYDFMWGLHIMDLTTREDAHNPLLIGFGLAALVMAIIALVQLPLTIRRRRRRNAA